MEIQKGIKKVDTAHNLSPPSPAKKLCFSDFLLDFVYIVEIIHDDLYSFYVNVYNLPRAKINGFTEVFINA